MATPQQKVFCVLEFAGTNAGGGHIERVKYMYLGCNLVLLTVREI
jgi:hypothetical protein